ncbi:glycosyltransferase family 39 protein [bacterium]|nr:glycosyltransferase family 39 protein [bacterium]
MNKLQQQTNLPLFEFIWVYLGLLTLISVGLLTAKIFTPLLSLIITTLLTALLFWKFQIKVELKDLRFDKYILLILLFAVVVRFGPWIYLEGGQDQGVYVMMSQQFERSGSLRFEDNLIDDLSSDLKSQYLSERGWFSLGFNLDKVSGELHTNFYPAHPALMSVAGFLFGDENRVVTLTLFGLLSIIAGYLLAYEITGKRLAGYITALFLATSPLHIYFSKFPTTEIMALAITLSTLYFIYKAYKDKTYVYLWISLLLINLFLYTRLTWVIALPFYLVLILCVLTFEKDKEKYKQWGVWGVGILLSFLVSTLFYYFNIKFLYTHFYSDIFKFIPDWLFYSLLFASPLVLYLLSTRYQALTSKVLKWVFEKRMVWLVTVLILILGFSAKHFYDMVFTDRFLGTRFDYFWGMARGGWVTLKDMALSSVVIYLTPFGILAYLLSLKSTNNPHKLLLTLFMLLYLGFNIVIVRYIPYHYYYARYQLSEIIPLLYVLISMYLVTLLPLKKWLFYLLLIPMLAYNIIYIPFLTQGPVGITPRIFNEIEERVGEDSILIYYNPTEWADNFFFAPLKYYYDFKSVNVENLESAIKYAQYFENQGRQVFVLSTVVLNDSRFLSTETLNFQKGFYANSLENNQPMHYIINDWQIPYCKYFIPEKFCSGAIPIKYHKASLDIYLYNYK